MDGLLWQLNMIVGMRTRKSRMTTMLQRRIIAWGGGEDRETVEVEAVEDMKKGINNILTNATAIKGDFLQTCQVT